MDAASEQWQSNSSKVELCNHHFYELQQICCRLLFTTGLSLILICKKTYSSLILSFLFGNTPRHLQALAYQVILQCLSAKLERVSLLFFFIS